MEGLPERVLRRLERAPRPLAIRLPDGRRLSIGHGPPVIEARLENERGLGALRSLGELQVVEAYLRGDLDLEGDLIAAMDVREVLSDVQPVIRAWTLVQPALVGRRRLNPQWIAKHYDMENVQLFAIDDTWQVYTPGIYDDDGDSLDQGAERKLAAAFDALALEPGDSVLDVGCGWGGFLRYCAHRGLEATGISLSRHQLGHARRRLDEDGLEATLLYQDFFTYEPGRRFDAISLMGSIEDLADYRQVVRRLEAWLRPGGRVYLDFAAVDRRFGVASFVTKHVWPGAFRMVYLPAFTRALAERRFDLLELHNDRRNYHLWARKGYERWMERRSEVLAVADEATWRLMRVLMAGTAHLMSPGSTRATAYRVVIQPRRFGAAARRPARARDEAIPASGSPT